jgi:hypothetical protein
MHRRRWNWRAFRHECAQCGCRWRKGRACCMDAPRALAPVPPAFNWNTPTVLLTLAMTRGQAESYGGGR